MSPSAIVCILTAIILTWGPSARSAVGGAPPGEMQRVLSGERARCIESSEEFVTKKLCLSFIIVCAFFSVLGGFFLGRYAASRTLVKKSATENKHIEAINQLSLSVNKINNLTFALSLLPVSTSATFNYGELYSRLKCRDHTAISRDFEKFKDNVHMGTFKLIATDLGVLQQCYDNASIFLETVLLPD